MDRCEQFKEIILTDYIDGALNAVAKKEVDDHLSQCAACQAFANEVKSTLVLPFEKANRQEVPAELWGQIKEQIAQEQIPQESFLDRVTEWLGNLSMPKLVPVLGSFVMVFFVSSMVFFDHQTKQAQDLERGSYLAYVLDTAGNLGQIDSDMETPIEQYFL